MKPTCKASLNTTELASSAKLNTDENDATIIDQAHSHIYVGSTYLSGRQIRPIKNNYLRMKNTFFTYVVSIVFVVYTFFCASLNAQDVRKVSSSKNNFTIAEELYAKKKYFEAIPYYEGGMAEKNTKKDNAMILHLADCYRLSRLYANAENLYKEITKSKEASKHSMAMFRLGQMQKAAGKYEDAIASFTAYLSMPGKDYEFAKMAEEEKKACEWALERIQKPVKSKPIVAGPELNKSYSNYAPRIFRDTLWMVGTKEISKSPAKIELDEAKGKYSTYLISRLYKATGSNHVWNERIEVPFKIKSEYDQINTFSFSTDNTALYLTICKEDNLHNTICHIYKSAYSPEVISEPVKLGAPVNIDKYSSKQPMLARINNNDVLFFASDRPDGFGAYDLYFCVLDLSGNCQAVVNLGNTINTRHDEHSPFYDVSLKSLFFSSKGHTGMGEHDIFRVNGDPFSGWKDLKNMGYPINTGADDYYYAHYPDRKGMYKAYMASNRSTASLEPSTCCDNVYIFDFFPEEKTEFFLKTAVYDRNKIEPITDYRLKIYRKKEKNIVADIHTGGSSVATVKLLREFDYKAVIAKNGYDSLEVDFSASQDDTLSLTRLFMYALQQEEQPQVQPQPEPHITSGQWELPLILWGFNADVLSAEAKAKLDKLAKQLKTEYPNVFLVISSHTDNIDSKGYNIQLSQRRTEAVINYLRNKGVDADRMRGQWYGEENPVKENQRSDGSDNPEGRRLNRRTEIKAVDNLAEVPEGLMVTADGEEERHFVVTTAATGEFDKETYDAILKKYGTITRKGLVFKVQLGAYLKPEQGQRWRMKMFADLQEKFDFLIQRETDGGYTKFLAANTFTLHDAHNLKMQLRQAGVSNAFIVPYYKQNRITMIEAIELLGTK